MPTECSPALFEFPRVEGRAVVALFEGARITSEAGALLLGATDKVIGLTRRLAHLIRWVGGIGWRAWVKLLVWRKVWVLRPTLMPDRNCHARHARRYAAWVLLASRWRQEGHRRL
jgi:hypothetical protein